MSGFPWAAYDRWLTTTPADLAHPGECGCSDCHEWHREEHIFEDECQACVDEKCFACNGTGWVTKEDECTKCQATGRIS